MKTRTLTLLLTSLCHLAFVQFSPAAELEHLWDFEGAEWWLDKVGEAHGTLTPATTLKTGSGAGEIGQAMEIAASVSGDDDHFVIDSTQLFEPGAEAFSMVYWIKMPDDQSAAARGVFDFSGNGQDGVQSLYIGASTELAFRIDFPGSDFVLAKAPLSLEDGEWHSVVATYDPTTSLDIHVDGFGVDATAGAEAGSVVMASDCYLGSFNFSGAARDNGLGGSLDDIAIYSGVLSEEEIIALSMRELPSLKPIDSVTYEDGAVTLTWAAQEGEIFGVWKSSDLESWGEIDDSFEAGADGARFTYTVPLEPVPDRQFFQVRRPE